MADFSALKQSIQNYIKQNGNKEITGNILQTILLSMVTTMGDGAVNDNSSDISDIKSDIQNINSSISSITTRLNIGALYAGYATPSTTPALLTGQEVFYLATQAGTYTNFHFNGGNDPIVLTKDGIYFIVSGLDDDDWNAEIMLQFDNVPTPSSNNAVKSGGVAKELALGAVYDVSAKNPTAGPNNGGKWESLSALLSDANLNTLIPTAVRKGGMSVKFVCSVDNKYVQYRLMANSFTTDVTKWQNVSVSFDGYYESAGDITYNGIITHGIYRRKSPKNSMQELLFVVDGHIGLSDNIYQMLLRQDYNNLKVLHRKSEDNGATWGQWTSWTDSEMLESLSSVNSSISSITTRLNIGALYAGYATPSTTPALLTGQEVFYLATQAGTYTNFHFNGGNDPIVLTRDGIYFIVSGLDDDDWNAEVMLQFDNVPTPSSNNAVKSGGVAEELALGAVYDVSAKNPTAGPNNDGKWESLSALLSDANLNTLIPTAVRKGGMSVKFVCSVDNKYVQYRLTADEFSTYIYDWVTIPIEVEETLYGDLVFSDEGGNCILSVSNHIRTKDFDSEDIVYNMQQLDQSIIEINETIEEDLPFSKDDEIFDSGITDEGSNILMGLYEGHIKTKNFDSKEVLEVLQRQAGALSDVQEELNEHEEILNNLPQIPKCKDQSETSEYITVLNDNFQTQTNIWEESWNRPQNGTFTPQSLNQQAKTSKRFFSDKRQVRIKTTLYNNVVLQLYSTDAQESSSYVIDLVNKKITLGTEEFSIQDVSITNGAVHEIVISIQNFMTKVSIYNTKTNAIKEIEMFGRQDYELKGNFCIKQTQGTLISLSDFSISILKNPKILFLGDSITAGAYFRSTDESNAMYVYHMYTKLIGNDIGDCMSVSAGGVGMSTFTEMWENEIQYTQPKAISALVGTNGGFTLQEITTLMNNLLTVTQKLFVHHLFGTNPTTYHLADYNQILEQALTQQEFSDVKSARLDIATSTQKSENTAENVTLDTSLMYDGVIHPNYEGSKAIVNRMKFDCPELFRLN